MLDHQAFGTNGNGFASSEGEAFAAYREAVEKSRVVKDLRRRYDQSVPGEVRGHLKYLNDDREIFARAFTQYVAEKTGDTLLIRQLAADRTQELGEVMYWNSDEFQGIFKALDKAFGDLGLL